MVMAMIRISGLGISVLGSAVLLAFVGCDSGGTTIAPGGAGSGNNTATDGGANGATGGKGDGTATGGRAGTLTGGAPAGNGGSGNTGNTPSCGSLTQPTATGTLTITGGSYVTSGTLKGYGFTWIGQKSNTTTCILPKCDTSGCVPTFGSTALCASGVVTADTTNNSVIGIGFNLNQAQTGGTVGTVAAPATVTVSATFTGSGSGNAAARIQIVDATNISYCVKEGTWTSGTAIPIGTFNTACWDGSGTALTAGALINAIDITVPSASAADNAFSICLTGATFS